MSSNIIFPISKVRLQNFTAEYREAIKQHIINDFVYQMKEGIFAKGGNPSMRLNTLNMDETDTTCYFDLSTLNNRIFQFAGPSGITTEFLESYTTPILAKIKELYMDTLFTKDSQNKWIKADWS